MAIEYVEITDADGNKKKIATDVVGDNYTPVSKIDLGADAAAVDLLVRGQQTKANSLPVTLASNEDALSVRAAAGTASIGKLGAGTASIGAVSLNAGTNAVGKLAGGTASIGFVWIL